MPEKGPAPGRAGTDVAGEPATDVAAASELLGFLRDLAAARRRPVGDLAAYEQVHWLAELPGDVYVETDAGPGDVLFSVPVIPLAPPAVLEEFDGWLGLRHWYRTLRDVAGRSAAQGDEVLLATGLLTWQPAAGPAVRDHLLATPVRIAVDERTERIDVVLAGDTSLRDRELLGGVPGFRPGRTAWMRDAVRSGQGFGLHASVGDVLHEWAAIAFPGGVAFHEDWAPDPAGTSVVDASPESELGAAPLPRLGPAPALVVRRPGRANVADYCAGLIDRLAAPGATVPGGLARFLSPGTRTPLLHVQECTPRTVPGLLTGLLVRGQRVLVATSDTEAAAELRAALPAEIAALTATATGSAAPAPAPASGRPGSGAEVAAALLSRAAAHDAESHGRQVAGLAEREEAARREVAGLRERLDRAGTQEPAEDVAEVEEREPPSAEPPGDGPPGSDAASDAASVRWLPPRPGLPDDPPVSAPEAADLVRLLAEETPERKLRTTQRDVDPGSLPSGGYVRTLIEAETAAAERAERAETELSRRLRDCDLTLLARLDGCASTVNAALRDLGLDGHPGGWKLSDLAARAFADALARRRPLVWARVAEMTSQAEWAGRALEGISGRHVGLPPGDLHFRKLAGAAQDLRDYLSDGGSLKRGPLRSTAQRQAEPLLSAVTVDGESPTTPELLDVVFADLMVRMVCQELQHVWEAAGVSFPADVPLADRVARFARAHARLARIREALPALDETIELLDRSGLGVPLTHPLQWHGYVVGLESVLLALGVARAAADLNALRDSIVAQGDDPPELPAAIAAIDARDPAGYGRCLDALADARRERDDQYRCEALLDRIRAVHPDLAYLLVATDGDEVWPGRMERWDEAWAWARAEGRRAADRRTPDHRSGAGAGAGAGAAPAAALLRAGLAEAETRLRDIGTELSAARAWGACLARLTPGGASPHDAVPAWIVPLWRIPDVLPPRPGSFDVVIVDGEHGAGAEALFVLWLAPRVILAGAPGPELPAPGGTAPAPLPGPLRDVATATSTLFETLLTRFVAPPPAGSPVREPEPEPVVSEPMPPVVPEPLRAPAQAPPQPQAPPPAAPPAPPARPSAPHVFAVSRGRSIVAYKRPELVELVGRIAAKEPDLTDEQIIGLARRMLGCPESEELLVGARLRYAVDAFREGHSE
ncbi:hypothetical protein [Spirillospora sp. NBC_01491]|uniref:hypothetical protein n=1 Tax=Spirillospora sp. NBC_01491 TaxID=2976007 RepID=UPI002E31AB44|nr:hypothetical protein [Spirillospora sp. NBC_01491]